MEMRYMPDIGHTVLIAPIGHIVLTDLIVPIALDLIVLTVQALIVLMDLELIALMDLLSTVLIAQHLIFQHFQFHNFLRIHLRWSSATKIAGVSHFKLPEAK